MLIFKCIHTVAHTHTHIKFSSVELIVVVLVIYNRVRLTNLLVNGQNKCATLKMIIVVEHDCECECERQHQHERDSHSE